MLSLACRNKFSADSFSFGTKQLSATLKRIGLFALKEDWYSKNVSLSIIINCVINMIIHSRCRNNMPEIQIVRQIKQKDFQ